MHKILLLSLALLFLITTGCAPNAGQRSAREETRILMERLEVLQADATKASNEARIAERSLQALREEMTRKEKEAAAERAALRQKNEEVIKALEDYKTKYRVSYRSRSKGQHIAVLDCADTGKYLDVEILALTPGELRFHHANGVAKVALGRLGTELRESLCYDPAEAAAWLKSESEKQASEEADDELLSSSHSATTSISKLKQKATFSTGARGALQASLNQLYIRGRALQADQKCCPIHKRYQLAECAQESTRLKQKLASLPR